MSRIIEIDNNVTISTLAEKLELPATNLVAELLKQGIMVTLNERIDVDTATILVEELGLDIELKEKQTKGPSTQLSKKRIKPAYKQRPPVVAIMGHVDHGKTSLLDKICNSSTVKSEAGGITQHISAHQTEHKGRVITLLDTPGHEAFAAIREHGAKLTDLAVIVVAADDGIKPQTLEAIRFANKAGVKMIVAVNKMDKGETGLNKVKQQLAEQNILVEGWGGEIIVTPVSAKTGKGIEELLDAILLIADVEELKADFQGLAVGLVIEAKMKKGMGPMAVVLVQQGILKHGDYLVAGAAYGRVKTLQTIDGVDITKAEPSSPVIVCGLKSIPEFGDELYVVETEKEAKDNAGTYSTDRETRSSGITNNEMLRLIQRRTSVTECNIIIKADVQGSLTSVLDSIKVLDTDEAASRIVSSGVGAVNESDIETARAAEAIIYCFNTDVSSGIRRMANQKSVSIKTYKVIYELLDDIKAELESRLPPEVIELDIAQLTVKGVFNTTKKEVICGGKVSKGKMALPSFANVLREGDIIASALPVLTIKKGITQVTEVSSGEMCGLSLETSEKLLLKEGDVLQLYTREIKKKVL